MANTKLTPLPEGFKITRCPATTATTHVKSTYRLLKEEERALERGYNGRVEMIKEKREQQRQETVAKIDPNALPECLRHLVPKS